MPTTSEDNPCAGGQHCCCCAPGDECCDCGAIMPQPPLDRSPAQFFFEVGYLACWAEAYVRAGKTPPFALTDAVVEHAWDVAGEAHDDPSEFDRYLALANATPAPAPSTQDEGPR